MFGGTINVYIQKQMMTFNARKGGDAVGLCFRTTEDAILDPCSEEDLFTYYPTDNGCDDWNVDPDRPTDIGEPCDAIEDKDLIYEATQVCTEACEGNEQGIDDCMFDVCIMEDISGADAVAESCEYDKENPVETPFIPSDVVECEPMEGVKFKWNKDKHLERGIRGIAAETHMLAINGNPKPNHALRHHMQKKYDDDDQPELKDMTMKEIACLCFAYCQSLGYDYFQTNDRRRHKRGVTQCQCYKGIPVFIKTRPNYYTGPVSQKAVTYLKHANVNFDVPETGTIETEENPHPGRTLEKRMQDGHWRDKYENRKDMNRAKYAEDQNGAGYETVHDDVGRRAEE